MALFILLMGVQGAGKGTQAAKLVEALGLPHVTTGGLFRAMKGLETPLAREIQAIMAAGNLVPDHITVQVVRERLAQPDAANGVIFDGFPRTTPQAEALERLLAEIGGKVNIAINLELAKDIAVKRLSARWQCSINDQHIYNVLENPPQVAGICDIDGGKLFQRPDDTPEAAEKRIALYFEQTAPLIEFYRAQGVLRQVNADQPIEAVTRDLLAAIEAVKKV